MIKRAWAVICPSFNAFAMNCSAFPEHHFLYFLALQVDMPKGAYNGQKLTTLVSKNIPDNTINTTPSVPEITSVAYSATMMAATTIRNTRSNFPMFFFMRFFI